MENQEEFDEKQAEVIAAAKMFDQAAKALFPDPVEYISLLELVFIQAVVDEYGTDDTVLETIHESAEEMFLSLREHAEEGE